MIAEERLYTSLIKNIKELVPISKKEALLIIDAFKPKKLSKKEFLLFKGDISNHMRFISEGCLRSYHINEEGQEYVLHFGLTNWWVNDLYSYLTKTPARFFIQALKPTNVLQIQRDDLNKLFDEVPAIERFFRIKIEKAYASNLNRTIRSMSETAETRYLNFIKTHRDIEQNVPQYMLASYLGITPQHLSTIRKKLYQ